MLCLSSVEKLLTFTTLLNSQNVLTGETPLVPQLLNGRTFSYGFVHRVFLPLSCRSLLCC